MTHIIYNYAVLSIKYYILPYLCNYLNINKLETFKSRYTHIYYDFLS